MSTDMIAAYVDELGPASSIRVARRPVPHPGPTEVLVAVEYSAVDPVDTFVRSGAYATPVPLPLVLGRDLVGRVVTAAGGFAEGERVWCNSLGHDGRQGAAAQYAAVPADRLYRLPDGVDPVLAVAVLHPAATACLALATHARVNSHRTVFVGGAAGNVGRAALVIGTSFGARMIASARPADHAECLRLGACEVLDFTAPDLDLRLRDVVPDGVDVYWDTSGRNDLERAVAACAPGGCVLLTAATADAVSLPVRAAYTRDIDLLGFVISRASVDELAGAARVINELLARDALPPRQVEVLPLREAAAAHLRMESGDVRGRLVLEIPHR